MVMAPVWDVLSRINARRVLLWICVCCVALLSLALLRNHVTQVGTFSLAHTSGPPPDVETFTAHPGAPTGPRAAPAENPFSSEYLANLQEGAERIRREKELARQRAQEPPPKVVETTPPPVQGPPRPEAKLLYRGMFSRPDGTVLGLIENQRSNRSLFHRVGDQIEGLTIGAISRSTLELIRDNEVTVTLNIGTPTSFQPE